MIYYIFMSKQVEGFHMIRFGIIKFQVSEKSTYEYEVPYWYGDACTCMVVLSIWIIIYIYIFRNQKIFDNYPFLL